MKIELHEIPIRDIVEGYVDNDEEGVFGYGGRLNIRPQYQREFVYKEKPRNAVIDTIMIGFALNAMDRRMDEEGRSGWLQAELMERNLNPQMECASRSRSSSTRS